MKNVFLLVVVAAISSNILCYYAAERSKNKYHINRPQPKTMLVRNLTAGKKATTFEIRTYNFNPYIGRGVLKQRIKLKPGASQPFGIINGILVIESNPFLGKKKRAEIKIPHIPPKVAGSYVIEIQVTPRDSLILKRVFKEG